MLCFVAPSAGPQVSTKPQTNGILVWWEEIPSHQQMGCITQYNIYLQKKNSNVDPYVYGRNLVKTTWCASAVYWGERGGEERGCRKELQAAHLAARSSSLLQLLTNKAAFSYSYIKVDNSQLFWMKKILPPPFSFSFCYFHKSERCNYQQGTNNRLAKSCIQQTSARWDTAGNRHCLPALGCPPCARPFSPRV